MAEASLDIEQAPGIESKGGKEDEKPQPLDNNVEANATKPKKVDAERAIVLSFRSLQLYRITELQDNLFHLAIISSSASPKPENHKDVVDKALRDYETLSLNAVAEIPPGSKLIGVLSDVGEYMTRESNRGVRNILASTLVRIFQRVTGISLIQFGANLGIIEAFLPSGSNLAWAGVKYVISIASASFPPSKDVDLVEKITGNFGFRELDKRGRILRAQKKAFTGRILMALFGGAALIGPMLIMILHRSLNTSLITVSVATFLFALLLALCATDSEGKDILAATAAYAAVLVVFVGTSGTG
ncbi:hypothetical protein V8E51_005030 [Hyaloscypha variabilis]